MGIVIIKDIVDDFRGFVGFFNGSVFVLEFVFIR